MWAKFFFGAAIMAIAGLLTWALWPVRQSAVHQKTSAPVKLVSKTVDRVKSRPSAAPERAKRRVAESSPDRAKERTARKRDDGGHVLHDGRENLSAADLRTSERIDKGRDEENLEGLRQVLTDALGAKSPEVRREMVEALGWFGKEALGDIQRFLADGDAGVREVAFRNWQSAYEQLDASGMKMDALKEAFSLVQDDEVFDALADGMMEIGNRNWAVHTLVQFVEDGQGKSADAGKRAFEKLTGEKYESRAQANLWFEMEKRRVANAPKVEAAAQAARELRHEQRRQKMEELRRRRAEKNGRKPSAGNENGATAN